MHLVKLPFSLMTLAVLVGCGGREKAPPDSQPSRVQSTAPRESPSATPKYQGSGVINDNLHLDMAVSQSGEYTVALSDDRGDEVPASEVSGLVVAFKQSGAPSGSVSLRINDTGESWVGRGPSVLDSNATALVALFLHGETVSASVPLSAVGGPLDYVCPMHPDIRSNGPGQCPRCGMKFVIGRPDHEEYPLDLRMAPATFLPGQRVGMIFGVKDPKTGKPVRRFEVVHERLFHLFILSADLKYFVHD